MQVLQALAHAMVDEEQEALAVLARAVQLAEPEGYIRIFVDEGAPMASLLSRLREQERKQVPSAYLDTVLAVFPQNWGSRCYGKAVYLDEGNRALFERIRRGDF